MIWWDGLNRDPVMTDYLRFMQDLIALRRNQFHRHDQFARLIGDDSAVWHQSIGSRLLAGGFSRFNRGFTWLSDGYGQLTRRLLRGVVVVLVAYGGLIAVAGFEFARTPTGFIPEQDQEHQDPDPHAGDEGHVLRPEKRFPRNTGNFGNFLGRDV
jgi:hypothetical protein